MMGNDLLIERATLKNKIITDGKVLNFVLHHGQRYLLERIKNHRFAVVCMGRRWGKSELSSAMLAYNCMKLFYRPNRRVWEAGRCAYIAPSFKNQITSYQRNKIEKYFSPIIARTRLGKMMNKYGESTTFVSGGTINYYHSANIATILGEYFDFIVWDEASFKDLVHKLVSDWDNYVAPTLTDYLGRGLIISSPSGVTDKYGEPNGFFEMFNRGNPNHPSYLDDWISLRMPSNTNPHLDSKEWESIKKRTPELAFREQYLAQFVNYAEFSFYRLSELFTAEIDKDMWGEFDDLILTVDSAYKTGVDNDGTAWILAGRKLKEVVKNGAKVLETDTIVLLDYEKVQVTSDMLKDWLEPYVCELINSYPKFRGVYIEDKGSGTTLIQSLRDAYPYTVKGLDSRAYTHVSKSDRALRTANHIKTGKVIFSKQMINKQISYKGKITSAFKDELISFRFQNTYAQADDLIDCMNYAIIVLDSVSLLIK